jgi:prepilin-type N-terminal cleavage/methylation domain-containing protein
MKKKFKDQFGFKGFTLLEIVVVIGIFAGIATIVVTILFISLRLSKKSTVLLNIRQNGNVALSQMIKSIRYAKTLDSPTSCVPPAPTSYTSITITSLLDEGVTQYKCPTAPGETISSNSAALIDTNSIDVVPGTCSFTCTQPTVADAPTITIQFTLTAKNANPALVETVGSIPFQSSVVLRNYFTNQ